MASIDSEAQPQIIVRGLTGGILWLGVNLEWTIADTRAAIAQAMGKGKGGGSNSAFLSLARVPSLAYKRHELRDHRTLSYYGIGHRDTLQILPPSKVPKTLLHFQAPTGVQFTYSVHKDATIAQLREQVAIEERMAVPMLILAPDQFKPCPSSYPDMPAPTSEIQPVHDHALSEYSLLSSQSSLVELPTLAPDAQLVDDDNACLSDYSFLSSLSFSSPTSPVLIPEVRPIDDDAHLSEYSFLSSPSSPFSELSALAPEVQPLDDNARLSDCPLLLSPSSLILISGQSHWAPRSPSYLSAPFSVHVRLRKGHELSIKTTALETLRALRGKVMEQHGVSVQDSVLIFLGHELTGEDSFLWQLGLIPDCTIHATSYVSFNVQMRWRGNVVSLTLHPLTRLSSVREKLVKSVGLFNRHWFTLDRRERLKESRCLWDLGLDSGSTLYIHSSTIFVMVKSGAKATAIDIEDEETVFSLKERYALLSGLPPQEQYLYFRDKLLGDKCTLAKENIAGGETIVCRTGRSIQIGDGKATSC